MARRSKTSAALSAAPPPAPPVATALALPAELTIYTVGELHPQWLAWLGQGAAVRHAAVAAEVPAEVPAEIPTEVPAEILAAAVEQVDAAGLQLLLSLQRAVAERGRSLQIKAPSAVLRDGCEALGLGVWLQAQMAPTAPAARTAQSAQSARMAETAKGAPA